MRIEMQASAEPASVIADTLPPTLPPEKHRRKRFHWLTCERASGPSVGEWLANVNGGVWADGTSGPSISPREMRRRGWEYWGPVKVPRELRHG